MSDVTPMTPPPSDGTAPPAPALFSGAGEMRALCRQVDWARTPLGPVAAWPVATCEAVRLTLASGFPMCLYAGADLVLIYNDAFIRALGRDKHPHALGRSARDCWPEIWPRIAPEFTQVLEGGDPIHFVNQPFAIERDGEREETYWTYAFSPVHDERAGIVAIHSVVTETTEQVFAERALAASDRHHAFLLQLEDELRPLTSALDMQRAAAELLGAHLGADHVGYAEPEPDGEHVEITADFLSSPHLPKIAGRYSLEDFGTALMATLRAGRMVVMPDIPNSPTLTEAQKAAYAALGLAAIANVPLRKDGVPFAILYLHFREPHAFTDDELQLLQAVAERTWAAVARARAEADSHQARLDAEAATRAKSKLIAVMSHEVRTPLQAIGSLVEVLESGVHGAMTDAQRRTLVRVKSSQQYIMGLVNELLTHATIETGGMHYELTTVNLESIAEEAVSLVAPAARLKSLTLTKQGMDEPVFVCADREKLQQVLVNLLTNAVKFTGIGGTVSTSCKVDGDVVRFTVRDTGIGIAPEQLASIFEPFVQVHANRPRGADGVGLGLSISLSLARGMGGDIRAESEIGRGSRFTLELPRAADRS